MAGRVEREQRVGRASRLERGPAQRDRVPGLAASPPRAPRRRCRRPAPAAHDRRSSPSVREQRAVPGGPDGDRHRVPAGHADDLLAPIAARATRRRPGTRSPSTRSRYRSVTSGPRFVKPHAIAVVVPDHDAGHAGEGEPGHVELAGAVQPHLVPDARHRRAEVRVVGERAACRSWCGSRRAPTSWSPMPGRRGPAAPAAGRAPRASVPRAAALPDASPLGDRGGGGRAPTGAVARWRRRTRRRRPPAVDDRAVAIERVRGVELVDLRPGQPGGGAAARSISEPCCRADPTPSP